MVPPRCITRMKNLNSNHHRLCGKEFVLMSSSDFEGMLQEAQDTRYNRLILHCELNFVTTTQVQLLTLILPSRKRLQNSVIFSAVNSSDSGLYLVISSSRVISRTAGHSSFFRPKNSSMRWLSEWSLSMKMNRILGEKRLFRHILHTCSRP